MTSHAFGTLLAAALFSVTLPAAAQLTVRDDLGRVLVLKEAPKRVVTLSPTLTEMVYAVGAGSLVVGVDSLSDYPPEVNAVAQIPTGAQFSMDRVATLKPDLIFAWREGTRQGDIEAMTASGSAVFVASARRIQDVPRLLEAIGRLTGRDPYPVIGAFESRLERLRRANAQKPRVTAFVEIWNRPLTTISGSHFLSEALGICRADNVFAERPGTAPKVSWDDVQKENPFLVVGAGSASSPDEFRANWAIRSALPAVKAQRLLYLESEMLQRPTPRMLDGMEQLCGAVDRAREGATIADLAQPAPERPAPFAGRAAIPAIAPGAAASLPRSPSAPSRAEDAKPAPDSTVKPEHFPAPAPEPAVKPGRRPSQYGT